MFPFLLSHDLLSSGSRACRPFPGSHIDFSFHSGSTFHKYIPNACDAMDKQKKREQHPAVSYRLVFASRKPMSFSLNGISPYKNKKPVISQPSGIVILLTFIQTKQSVQCRYLLLPKRQRTNNIYEAMIAHRDMFVKIPPISTLSDYGICLIVPFPDASIVRNSVDYGFNKATFLPVCAPVCW